MDDGSPIDQLLKTNLTGVSLANGVRRYETGVLSDTSPTQEEVGHKVGTPLGSIRDFFNDRGPVVVAEGSGQLLAPEKWRFDTVASKRPLPPSNTSGNANGQCSGTRAGAIGGRPSSSQ